MAAAKEKIGSRLAAHVIAAHVLALLLLLAALAAPAQAHSTLKNRAWQKSTQDTKSLLSQPPQLLAPHQVKAPPQWYDAPGATIAYDNAGRRTGETWYDTGVADFENPVPQVPRESIPRHITAAYGIDVLYTASYTHTALGEVETAADPHSSYTFDYDPLRQVDYVELALAPLPDVIEYFYDYDLLGNRTQLQVAIDGLQDFKNVYQYDDLGRVTQIEQNPVGAGVATDKLATYHYDAAGRLDHIFRYQAGNAVANTEIDYYDHGRPEVIWHNRSGGTDLVNHRRFFYDEQGRVSGLESLKDEDRAYQYDAQGQIIADDARAYDYDALGNRGETGPHNRVSKSQQTEMKYDFEGNVIQRKVFDNLLEESLSFPSSPAHVFQRGPMDVDSGHFRVVLNPLVVDAVTNQLTITVQIGSASRTFAIAAAPDSNGETSRTGRYFEDFVIETDQQGVQVIITFEDHDPANGDDPEIVEGSFAVQRLGKVQKYGWDHRNRLTDADISTATYVNGEISVVQVGGIDYTYDVFGNRIAAQFGDFGPGTVGGEDTVFVPENGHLLLEFKEFPGSGQHLARRNLLGPGVDQLLASENLNYSESAGTTVLDVTWALTDEQGTVRDVIFFTEGGALQDQHFTYDTFGQPLQTLSNRIRQGYAGREYDSETGLYYNRARYYDSSSSRFLSEDPRGFSAGDANLYRYAANSPTNFTDPTGTIIESPWDFLSVGVGVVSIGLDIYNIATTGQGWTDLGIDTFGLGVDLLAAAIPGIPGGVSIANRAARAANQVVRVGRTIDTGLNVYQAGRSGVAAYDAYQQGDLFGASLNLVGAGLGTTHFALRAHHFHRNYRIVDQNPGAVIINSGGFGKITALRIERRLDDGLDDFADLDFLGQQRASRATAPDGRPLILSGDADASFVSASSGVRNFRGEPVRIPEGHVMSPRDPAMSALPEIRRGPFTTAQREAFLAGQSGGTRISPHHRHQIPTTHGGVIDELPGPEHPAGNVHTAGSPSRHPSSSVFNSTVGGNALRSSEIRAHWQAKGQRLVEVEPGVWIDPGP